MKHINQLFILILLAGIAAGCVNESPSYGPGEQNPGNGDVGYFNLNSLTPQVLLDSEISSSPIIKQSAVTRAITEAEDEYVVRIYDSSNTPVLDTSYGELKTQFTSGSEQNLLELPVGSYRLYVCSHQDGSIKDMEWDDPVYSTDYNFSIQRSHTTDNPQSIDGEVICKLSNIKVTVTISADLAALLGDDTQSTVSLNDASAVFTKDETRAAFFRPQSTGSTGDTLEFLLTGTKDGEKVQLNKTITGVKGGQWRKITLSIVHSEYGDLDIGVTVDSFVVDDEIDINSTASLWEPILEEPSGLPELTWPDHDLAEGFALTDAMYDEAGEFTGSAPVLTLASAHGIQSVLATLTTDNATFRSEIIESGGLTDVDLCSTLSRLHPFRTLQLTPNATESSLDLNSIMWIFYGYSGTHTLTFNMTDTKGQNSVASLTFTYGGGSASEDPSIVCRQFDIDQPKVITSGQEIDVDINTTSGIKAFVVTITSETLNEEVLGAVNLKPSFDLCNITDQAELEALTSDTIGFPVNEDVKGKTSLAFSISKFVDMLIMFPGTHQFTLSVTNETGSTTTKTLTLIVEGE